MDQVLADTLKANLKSAKSPDEVQKAMTLAMVALVDCQCKTSGRVKWLVKMFVVLAALVAVAILCGNETAAKLLQFGRG